MNTKSLESLKEIFEKPGLIEFDDFMGQKTENSVIKLGYRLNSDYDISSLMHEICHLAELPIKRVLDKPSTNYDFSYGVFWQIGTSWGYEPKTDQATQREIRAWSYQYSLQKEIGIPIQSDKLVKSVVWMNDFTIYKYKHGHKTDNDVISSIAKIVESNSRDMYSYKNLMIEWKERVEALHTKRSRKCIKC
jgi:hypothetical protein